MNGSKRHASGSRRVAVERRGLLARARTLADGAAEQRRRHGVWTVPLIVAGSADALRAVSDSAVVDAVQADLALAAVPRAGVGDAVPLGSAERQGWLHVVRGAAGELHTLDRIGDGRIGVPAGADRVELLPFTAPGADLVLSGPDIEILGNVKMTSTAAPILRHVRDHPDVPVIYASREAAVDAAQRGLTVVGPGRFTVAGPAVVDTGVSIADLDASIAELRPSAGWTSHVEGPEAFTQALAEGPLDGLGHVGEWVASLAAPLADVVPLGSVLVVGTRAVLRGNAVATGHTLGLTATDRAQLLRAAVATAAAKGTSALTAEPTLGLVAAVTTNILLGGIPSVRRSWLEAAERERAIRARSWQR